MNRALLGKQAWRMITNNDSIVASLLLPKYYRNEEFTEVKPQANSSWIWKIMLVGRDVILKGLDVQVWSGEQTSFSEGRLVKRRSEVVDRTSNLQNFMCPITHAWKSNQTIDSSLQENLSLLHQKTFSVLGGQDKSVWKFNFNGDYSVSSTYWMLSNEDNADAINNWKAVIWKTLVLGVAF